MNRSTQPTIHSQLRKADRLRAGVRVRISLHFNQDELRLLASFGFTLDDVALRAFIRESAFYETLRSMERIQEGWTYRDGVWVDSAGRAFDLHGRPVRPGRRSRRPGADGVAQRQR